MKTSASVNGTIYKVEIVVRVSRLQRCWYLLRYFGPQWLMYRGYHAARMKSGLIRRQLPTTTWAQQSLSAFLDDPSLGDIDRYAAHRQSLLSRFFFNPLSMSEIRPFFARWDSVKSCPQIEADDLRNGFARFFSHERVEIGFPPRWHSDPFTGHPFPTDCHWSQIADFGAGDIKLVWETNRFGFVFSLVRSYWRTGDEQYAELFWQLVHSWHSSNPPETGANWKCGQEIGLRVMAWCFGLYGFGASPASTPSRIAMLAQMIAVSGHRIESNIGYALSQQNNHGLSEAMGLWTIGALFPEFKRATHWAALGRRLLERQAFELIYEDGAFSQHSMNYHRVMLHDYLWSMRLGDVLEQPFSDRLRDRIGRAGEFAYQVQDEFTGRVPCYGNNDGALILPLSNCDYRDYRPVVQATHVLTTGRRRLEEGPWDEDLLWMFGPASISESPAMTRIDGKPTFGRSEASSRSPSWNRIAETANTPIGIDSQSRCNFDAPNGGYSTLRSSQGFAMTRAASFRHRPAQADMLHVDIWWRGENIAIDPGTYSYNAPSPWDNRLAQTACHNTVTVDGEDQMERASRFLWLPWLTGSDLGRNVRGRADIDCWNGEHDGYRRLADPITHRRSVIRLGSDHWFIADSLEGRSMHSFRLHWLLMDAPYECDPERNTIALRTSAGSYGFAATSSRTESKLEVVRAARDSAEGWCSPYYHAREPAISVSLEATASRVVFATVFGPEVNQPVISDNVIQVDGLDWNAAIALNLSAARGVPLVASIESSGSLNSLTSISNPHQQPTVESHQCTSC